MLLPLPPSNSFSLAGGFPPQSCRLFHPGWLDGTDFFSESQKINYCTDVGNGGGSSWHHRKSKAEHSFTELEFGFFVDKEKGKSL